MDTSPIAITGHSDDLIHVEADGHTAEVDAYGGVDILIRDPHNDDTLLIRADYLQHGVWALAPTMPSEAHPLPDWDVVLTEGHDYSPTLVVHAPDGAQIDTTG